jgi:hypothetical protein
VHDIVETACSPCSWLDRLEPFGEDSPRTGLGVAEEAARSQYQRDPDACGRKIRALPPIFAMDTLRNSSARRTATKDRRRSDRDDETAVVLRRALNDKPARNEFRNLKPLHRPDPQPESEPNWRLDFIKSESDPIIHVGLPAACGRACQMFWGPEIVTISAGQRAPTTQDAPVRRWQQMQ